MTARKTAGNKKSRQGRLRIVAGKWRSRLLQIADVPGLRPTSMRIRETLFNWLAPRIQGARCLDICAGTGALGLEALSRGATEVVFVENSAAAVQTLIENIASLQADRAEVLTLDARRFLQQVAPRPFDIVFLDPPFAADLHDELCRLLAENGWLANDSLVYVESDRAQSAAKLPQGWQVLKDKTAGNVRYVLIAAHD